MGRSSLPMHENAAPRVVPPPSNLGGVCRHPNATGRRVDRPAVSGASAPVVAPRRRHTQPPVPWESKQQHPVKNSTSDVLAAVESLYADAEETACVLAAVESLYEDMLKPSCLLLGKRLSERAAGSPLGSDAGRLRARCEACAWLRIEAGQGGEWSALLTGKDPAFIDITSPMDLYPPGLWDAFGFYLESLSEQEAVLPGDTYACACVLAARHLPFLFGCSLGQVCHIVQVAISQKRLLGFQNGCIVPYARLQTMVEDACGLLQQVPFMPKPDPVGTSEGWNSFPPTPMALGEIPPVTATWEILRACIHNLLWEAASEGAAGIPLSSLRHLIRCRCGLEMSETALGHSKLSELLQDTRLNDICGLRFGMNGYVITQPHSVFYETSQWSSTGGQVASAAVSLSLHESIPVGDCASARAPEALEIMEHIPADYVVLNTFVHTGPSPQEVHLGSRRRSQSSPKSLGSTRDALRATCHALRYRQLPVKAFGEISSDNVEDTASPTSPPATPVKNASDNASETAEGSTSASGGELSADSGDDEPTRA